MLDDNKLQLTAPCRFIFLFLFWKSESRSSNGLKTVLMRI